MADEQAAGMACPTCWNNGSGIQAMLFSRPGRHGLYCRQNHEFNDTQELLAMNPPKLQVPQKKTAQQGHVSVSLAIPADLQASLLLKFGNPERLAQTVGGLLRTLADKECLIVNEEDLKRIEQHTGQKPKTGQELVGIVYQKQQELVEARNAASARSSGPATPSAASAPEGKLLISAEEFLPKARAIANFRHETVEQVCENTLKLAFDNGWA